MGKSDSAKLIIAKKAILKSCFMRAGETLGRFGSFFVRRWIAGISIDDALGCASHINVQDKVATINYLGEDLTDPASLDKTLSVYIRLMTRIKKLGLKAEVAVKPTQIGLAVNYDAFYKNYAYLVRLAKKQGVFLWMDAERHDTLDNAYTAYIDSLATNRNIGVCVQAYLRRACEYAEGLTNAGGVVRLVKGAYRESIKIAYRERKEISKNYVGTMEYLFRHSNRFMIATHDEQIIRKTLVMEKKFKKKVMFGMLNGIKGNLASQLSTSGEDLHVYVPFGEEWLPYVYRRMREGGASFILRSVFSR